MKPKLGLVVRDPHSKQPLPESGREVQPTSYWLRRLADGDVVEVAPPVAPAGPQLKKEVKP